MRYLRLYLYFLRFSFSKAMEFRVDFTFRIFMDMMYYLINIGFYQIIFLHTNLLGGWSEEQMMVFVGGYILIDALQMTFVSNNLWWLPIFINKGELDYYLVRPVSSLFFLSLRDFAANSFVNLLMALGVFGWAFWQYSAEVSLWQIGLYFVLLLHGVIIYYSVRMLTIIPVFWTHSGRGFERIFWSFSRLMERPDRIFTGWVRKILITVLPFSVMASFPAKQILDEFSWPVMIHLWVITLTFFGIVVLFWRIGLKSYASASS